MGFSLKNTLQNALQLDRAAVAQLNPFDGGQTFKSVQKDAADAKAGAAQAQKNLADEKAYDQAHGIPSLADYTRAMLNTKQQNLPQDNLDGTYKFNPAAGSDGAVIAPSWHPPLAIGQSDGIAHYTPIAGAVGQYDNSGYYAIPINEDAIPKPMPLLRPMLGGMQ